MMNLANSLTVFRLVLLPVIIALFFFPGVLAAWVCLALYIIAAVTDFFDGWVARRYGQVSAFGKFLDPISDKIFVVSLMLVLVGFERLPGLWMVPAIIIISREFLISGLREFLGPQNVQIPVSPLAKWKTGVQMTALGFLVIGNYGDVILPHTLLYGQIGLAIAAGLTVLTGWGYLKTGFLHIRS